jgi:hypothetical protein
MSLTERLSGQVAETIRQQGRNTFVRGTVKLLPSDQPQVVNAEVRDPQTNDVILELKGKTLRYWCSCDTFARDLEVCKHVWASLLAVDVDGKLEGAASTGRLRLEPSDDAYADDALPDDSVEDEDWDDDFEEPAYDPEREWGAATYSKPQPARRRAPRQVRLGWKKQLASLKDQPVPFGMGGQAVWPVGRELVYIVDVASTLAGPGGLSLEVAYRERKRDGEWTKPRPYRVRSDQLSQLPDAGDRQILAFLAGAREQGYFPSYGYSYYDSAPSRYTLGQPLQAALVPLMCGTGRCFLRESKEEPELRPLAWDDGPPWEFWLDVVPEPRGKNYVLTGSLRRGEERQPLSAARLLLVGGLVIFDDRAARLHDFRAMRWFTLFCQQGSLTVPVGQKEELLNELLKLPQLPRLNLPEELRFEEQKIVPRPRLKVKPGEHKPWRVHQQRLRGELSFDYDGVIVAAAPAGRGVYQAEQRRFLLRDLAAEAAAAERIRQLGFRAGYTYYNQTPALELAPRNLPRVVRALLAEGWHVEAEGKVYRRPGNFNIEVSSGIDWFELHGTVQFDDKQASLPALLAAVKRGDNIVKLDDGTFGMVPEGWLKKYGMLAGLGKAEGDHLRFSRAQVGLLDALLASQPEASCDAVFARARDELRRFAGIEPADPPAGFVGELRSYQRDGLGWLHFLPRFGFGGCLADDMGLGKTVQVLALLEARRELRASNKVADRPPPSLVVVPRSLVFNWKQEAARFTPQLRVLDHTGIGRPEPGEHFHEFDVVLTTYGTLRRDILKLKDFIFDYCILDEAQAVKNASTESAKATRLLQAANRLALSGTPVENHLGELWSLFEFLNPGMLGGASVFRLGGTGARNPDEETRSLLAQALRPFILRRTKQQVAKDLPQKTEQTLYCELEPAQRQLYDELRQHYRQALLERVAREGLARNKIQVLEALLRLRQAACHPGLIDKKRGGDASAKLDMLLPQIAEVIDEGHKVLVFSQFTSLLALVRDRLDSGSVVYEYLDGRTRNRQEKVERFQNDPECRLFLVSLKAGGLGLNLTAAEYVYLLDPWWNPAVEAQAIDRTHRIGQTRPVFAYRLIARDTVEEKVLELQKTKRDLADAIINADNSLIRNLSQEDLRLLLS